MRPLCFTALLLALAPGCSWARRASLSAVDPELRAKGAQLDRGEDPDGFALGTFRVAKPELQREAADTPGLLAPDTSPRPVVQHRLSLEVEAPGESAEPGRQWSVGCIVQRRQPASMDYASALDENRDEVGVACELGGVAQGVASDWAFRTQAELSHNFAGRLTDQSKTRSLDVEVVVWVERFGKVRRHLPDPVAQVREGDTTIAAMVLSRPEQAWLAPEVDPETAEVAISTMLALRFLPLGLE
ncbi:MAG: hypothetical protein AAF721_15615 [Myxococcota bacterium]